MALGIALLGICTVIAAFQKGTLIGAIYGGMLCGLIVVGLIH